MLRFLIIATGILVSCYSFANLPLNQLDADKVKAGEKPIILLGNPVKLKQQAPNFKVVNGKFNLVQLSDYKDKAVLISVVPSLDTGVCSLQTKHFNEKLAIEFPDLVMLTISADLPFAQKRFCMAENIDKITTLSDSVWRHFGENYGLIIKDMGLLTRSVFILNKHHQIVYKQLVPNLSQEPDYLSVEIALKKLK